MEVHSNGCMHFPSRQTRQANMYTNIDTPRMVAATKEFHKVGLCRKVLFYRPDKDQSGAKRPGTRGCWESHRYVAKTARDEWGLSSVLIFEDDVKFDDFTTPQRIRELEEAYGSLPKKWNAFHIGHWSIVGVPIKKNIFRSVSLCTHSYFMSRRLMNWIIEHPFDNTGFAEYGGFGIDCYFAKMKRVYAFFPMMCYQSGSPSSNPKPKFGGKILDAALSDPKYMKASQVYYNDVPTFIQYIGLITAMVLACLIIATGGLTVFGIYKLVTAGNEQKDKK